MSQVQFQLKGWPAVGAVVIAAAFLGYKVFLVHASLGPEQLEEVRVYLRAEYSGRPVDDLRDAIASGHLDRATDLAAEIQAMQDIEFVSIKARGTDEVVVRLEIEVDGGPPPDGRNVRYYIMTHSMITGWRVKRPCSSWNYYLKLF